MAALTGAEKGDKKRYCMTQNHIRTVRQALLGNCGETCSRGYIQAIGKPSDIMNNKIEELLSTGTEEGPHLLLPIGYHADAGTYYDGWGGEIEVKFLDENTNEVLDDGENRLYIKSFGKYGEADAEGGKTFGYEKDVVEYVYWRRKVAIKNTQTDNVNVCIAFPYNDGENLQELDLDDIPPGGVEIFSQDIPVGTRRLEVRRSGPSPPLIAVYDVRIPEGRGTYTVTI